MLFSNFWLYQKLSLGIQIIGQCIYLDNNNIIKNDGSLVRPNQKLAKSLIKNCPQWLQYHVFNKNETVFDIYPQHVIFFFCFLKHHINAQYKVLIDLTGVDYPSRGLSQLWRNLISPDMGRCVLASLLLRSNPFRLLRMEKDASDASDADKSSICQPHNHIKLFIIY